MASGSASTFAESSGIDLELMMWRTFLDSTTAPWALSVPTVRIDLTQFKTNVQQTLSFVNSYTYNLFQKILFKFFTGGPKADAAVVRQFPSRTIETTDLDQW